MLLGLARETRREVSEAIENFNIYIPATSVPL